MYMTRKCTVLIESSEVAVGRKRHGAVERRASVAAALRSECKISASVWPDLAKGSFQNAATR